MSSQEPSQRWVSVQEAADALGVSVRTVYRWIDKGDIEHRREGRRVYVNIADRVPAERQDVIDTSDIEGLRLEVVKLRAQVDKLSSEVDNLSARNSDLAEDKERLWRQADEHRATIAMLTRLTEQIAIEAPKSEAEAVELPRERPWWRFWGSED